MTEGANFNPAWASPPGHTIADLLLEREWEVDEFAQELGYLGKDIKSLLEGSLRINADLAGRLAAALGASPQFWLDRDAQYCADLERLKDTESEQAFKEWVREMPVASMTKWGWIPRDKDKKTACLDFFDVSSLAEWRAVYGGISELVAFRKSEAHSTSSSALAAWLRQGEIDAEKIACEEFDKEVLRGIVPQLRSLTRVASPEEFLPEVIRLCATAGVAVAIVRAPTGCAVSGAARFLSPTKALIQLSFRYRSDDHFWFTLFHEIGHLLLHGRDGLFLEGVGLIDTHEEDEANAYSATTLIPTSIELELRDLGADYRTVMRFAKRIGISAGIVIGQMQHRGLLPRNYLNKLKVRYAWRENATP